MSVVDLIIFLVFAAALLVGFFKHKFSFWENLGVPFVEPRIPYGNIQGHRRVLHSSQVFARFYSELKEKGKFGGIYFFTKPVLFVTDLDLLRIVLIKDFQHFHDRGMYYNVKDDPLSGHLLNIEGDYWKKLREKLTPTFTSGKIRQMMPTILEVGKRLDAYMETTIESDPEHEIKEILARFTIDVIGSVAFGIECNSLEDKSAKFYEMGLKVFRQPRNSFAKQLIAVTYPKFARKIGITTTRDDVSEFFTKIVKDVVEYREKNNVKRNDFMDLLLQLKNERESADESGKLGLTVDEIAAQVFVFFLAGFETSATTMTFCLHELSLNQEIQDKARENIMEVLDRHDGKITYESLSEMTYLEQCINESLRKFPPGASLIRKVTKDYKVPESTVVIKEGMTMLCSIYGIHHDPAIYPDPERFDPERFSHENSAKRHPMAFIPFGEGPRICIGMRFGMIETKVGLVTLLSKFRFHKSDRTKLPLTFELKNIVLSPENLYLKIEKI